MNVLNRLSPEWVTAIQEQHAALQASEETVHNRDLHARILSSWMQTSPQMMRNLERAGIADALAFVVQQRMWAEQADLTAQGMPVTDAREQAERNQLMLEPETA